MMTKQSLVQSAMSTRLYTSFLSKGPLSEHVKPFRGTRRVTIIIIHNGWNGNICGASFQSKVVQGNAFNKANLCLRLFN